MAALRLYAQSRCPTKADQTQHHPILPGPGPQLNEPSCRVLGEVHKVCACGVGVGVCLGKAVGIILCVYVCDCVYAQNGQSFIRNSIQKLRAAKIFKI